MGALGNKKRLMGIIFIDSLHVVDVLDKHKLYYVTSISDTSSFEIGFLSVAQNRSRFALKVLWNGVLFSENLSIANMQLFVSVKVGNSTRFWWRPCIFWQKSRDIQ